jgi:hypothetical protein
MTFLSLRVSSGGYRILAAMYLENGQAYPETDDERWALDGLEASESGGYDPIALAALYKVVANDRMIHASNTPIRPALPDTAIENLRRYRILRSEVDMIHAMYEEES